MAYWITLPHEWKLQDVQAALNVVITALSALTIFAFTRLCWQVGARKLVRDKSVATSTLLTLNTPGEVFESFVFLKSNLVWHGKLLIQGVIISIFALITLFSGPIARYSTRFTQTIIQRDVDGLLTCRYDNSMATQQHAWNLTVESLNEADFPMDQLLDYLPNTSVDWVYQPEEWNNTWSLSCQSSETTTSDFTLTDNCTTFGSKFEGMIDSAIPMGPNSEYFYESWGDFYTNRTYIKDLLVVLYAANYTDYKEETDTYRTIEMAVSAVHAHGVPKNDTEDNSGSQDCWFGEGPVTSATYNRVQCLVTRTNNLIEDPDLITMPDTGDTFKIPNAFISHYVPRFKHESMGDLEITLPTPDDLIRFYQTYMVTKDTQQVMPVQRRMSVSVPAVQVAALFVVIFALLFVFVCLGASSYLLFWLWHRKALETVPQSKLDWLVYSIVSVPTTTHGYLYDSDRKSATTSFAPVIPGQEDSRAQFEAAIFHLSGGTAVAPPLAQAVYQPPEAAPALPPRN